MSTDRTKDKRVNPTRSLAEIKPLNGIKPAARILFATEFEISDETLEAVAGGGVTPVSPDAPALSDTPVE